MSYTHGKRDIRFLIATGEQLLPLQTAAVKAVLHPGLNPLMVTGFWVLVTTAGSGNAASLEVNHRSAPGVTSGETAIATVTFPSATLAAGQVVYERIAPVKVLPGEELALELLTANTSGVAICGLEVYETSESVEGLDNVHESA